MGLSCHNEVYNRKHTLPKKTKHHRVKQSENISWKKLRRYNRGNQDNRNRN